MLVDPLNAARKTGVIVVRPPASAPASSPATARRTDDKYDSGRQRQPQSAEGAHIVELALTKTSDTKAIQDMFWKY